MSELPQPPSAEIAIEQLTTLLGTRMRELEAMLDAHAEQFGHEPGLRERLYVQLQSIVSDQREHELPALEGDALRTELLAIAREFLDGYFLDHPDQETPARSTIADAVTEVRSAAASTIE